MLPVSCRVHRKNNSSYNPTISLMQDQTLELNSKGIKATFLGSAQSDPLAETKAFDVDNPTPIIYVSPEWLFGEIVQY